MRLLVDHRDDLVRERTRIESRIRCHLHEIDPALQVALARPARLEVVAKPARSHRRPPGQLSAALDRDYPGASSRSGH